MPNKNHGSRIANERNFNCMPFNRHRATPNFWRSRNCDEIWNRVIKYIPPLMKFPLLRRQIYTYKELLNTKLLYMYLFTFPTYFNVAIIYRILNCNSLPLFSKTLRQTELLEYVRRSMHSVGLILDERPRNDERRIDTGNGYIGGRTLHSACARHMCVWVIIYHSLTQVSAIIILG